MEKFDSLLTRLKSHAEGDGTLLDHTLVLYGSGMGHSDNHTATRIPIILAGGQGMLKTGRYVRYSDNQQLGRLHFALLKKFGLNLDAYGRSMDPLSGFDASDFELYRERAFESWVRVTKDGRITVQGHLRMSDNLDDAKVFFVDVVGRPSVRVEVPLRDFHQFNLAYHCGTGITLSVDGERAVITKVHDLQSIFGKAPGTQAG